MLKLILPFLFSLVFIFQLNATTYISFKIDAATSTEIFISYLEKQTGNNKMLRINLKGNNETTTILNLSEPTFVNAIYNNQKIPLFISPNDDLKVQFTNNDFLNSFSFSGKGSQANQILNDYYKNCNDERFITYTAAYITSELSKTEYDKALTSSPNQYYNWLGEHYQKRLEWFSKIDNTNSQLKEFIQKDIYFNYNTQKIIYLLVQQGKVGNADAGKLAVHHGIYDNIGIEYDYWLTHPAYLNYLKTYAHFLHLPKGKNAEAINSNYYNQIERNIQGESRDLLLSGLLINVYEKEGDTDLAKNKFSSFKQNCNNPKYITPVEQLYGDILLEAEETEVPDFAVVDEYGRESRLHDYKGQVVFISFWAHWCKPCINNFEKSVQLRAQLKKMGVVLLNVHVEKNETAWRNALAKYQIYGQNVQVKNVDDLKRTFGISSLPDYHIMNKQGKFVYLSDKMDRDIVQEFRAFVEE